MKKRTFLKSAASFALAVVLLLAMSVPALAAGDNIVITAPKDEPGEANRFVAYQVFSGSLVASKTDEIDGIEWGTGVNPTNLVTALKASTQTVPVQIEKPYEASMTTFGAQFSAAYGEYEKNHDDQLSEAEFVAQWLGNVSKTYTDAGTYNPYADAFARAVAANLSGGGTASTKSSDTEWTINVGTPGYYLVKDTYEGEKASISSYILRVLGTARVEIKATIPTVEEKIVSGSELVDGILTETETDVTYQLTGTVSENIAEYTTYAYTFTDTLSKGLTLNGTDISNLTVTYKNTVGTAQATFTKDTDYTATTETKSDTGETVLTVKFENLKQALTTRLPGIDLTNKSLTQNIQIIVTYKAHLNKDAVIGGPNGNPNDVVLSYSNNPYGEGTGETVRDEVKTYTLALRIVKNDESGKPLSDVEFKLMKGQAPDPTTASNQFATFADGSGTHGTGEAESYKEISGWGTGIGAGGVLTTDGEGVFNIHGLSSGTYTLVETKTPEGYETMKPIVFTIDGTVDATGALTKAELSMNGAKRQDVELNNNSLLAHNAQLTLTNYPLPILPHTGGIGAGIVYLVSALAVLTGAAIVYLAVRKRGGGRHAAERR